MPLNNRHKCAGCTNTIDPKEIMCCSLCSLKYDLACANLSDAEYIRLSKQSKATWQCEECQSKQPKLCNIHRPVTTRKLNIPKKSKPGPSKDCRNDVKDKKQKPGEADSFSIANLREIIKEEIYLSIKHLELDKLDDIDERLTNFDEEMSSIRQQYEEVKKDLEDQTDIIRKLRKDNTNLQCAVKALSMRLDPVQQRGRNCDLEITGIPKRN